MLVPCGAGINHYSINMRYLIGVDEAGRGPLAGPVAVGAVIVPHGFDWKLVVGAKDSKQMTAKQREDVYKKMRALRARGELDFAVSFTCAATIDKHGIVPAIQSALNRSIMKCVKARPWRHFEILLDGNLRAPEEYINQKTIILGDQSEPVISLASIAAKVMRDRLMVRLARKYPVYKFEEHKGYGTLGHRRAIAAIGLSDIHRATFCTRLPIVSKSV